jgi:hypothetical protein
MLPPADPGQGDELQRISGSPPNTTINGRRAFP